MRRYSTRSAYGERSSSSHGLFRSTPHIENRYLITMSGMKELFRGAVFLHILHHAAEEPIHGAWMSAELATHGYDISPGTLYPTLHRMEADGLLASEKRTVNGRVLRLYRATAAGGAALTEGRRAVRELAEEILPLTGADHDETGHHDHQ